MKNVFLPLLCVLLFGSLTQAQDLPVMIAGTTGKFFVNHAVVPKENWYSVGRLFNISPREIAPFNNLSIDKPLDIGQSLKIPLTAGNFSQKDDKAADETLIPVYHQVQEKEWMFRLSAIYNDVSVANLEKWNKIKRDEVKPGMTLIVGYLRVKTSVSPLAAAAPQKPAQAMAATKQELPPIPPAKNNSVPVPDATVTKNNAAAPLPPVPAADNTATPQRVNTYATDHSTGGFFSSEFAGTGKSVSGVAATFKSTSGWNDGKYYALMNSVPVGAIIKISAGANGKLIYAKVLGQLPDMKESTGLLIRISNAATAELGLGEGKFPVSVLY